jgi:hypothetical protein
MHDSDCFYPILFELTSCCLKYTFPEMYSVSLLDDSGTFRIEINEKGIFSGKLEGEEKIPQFLIELSMQNVGLNFSAGKANRVSTVFIS